eukprot:TRINITY_DN66044_c0_g1_i1.p2 TRINITY_DN66044_c0_g1~~TRINITY_DN66044_c0_g1_i1.p2  ORF type:complete len:172 (+),score=38.80 TRINITY_DN66044_c0_g1_i1:68-517(+)
MSVQVVELTPGPTVGLAPSATAGRSEGGGGGEDGDWGDVRDVVREWGSDPDQAPRFRQLLLWGLAAPLPDAGPWTVATAMYQARQGVLTADLEPCNGDRSKAVSLVIVRPGGARRAGGEWTVPAAESITLGGTAAPQHDPAQPAVRFAL